MAGLHRHIAQQVEKHRSGFPRIDPVQHLGQQRIGERIVGVLGEIGLAKTDDHHAFARGSYAEPIERIVDRQTDRLNQTREP